MPQVGIVATNRHDVHALLATLKLACNRRHRAPSSTRKRARHRRRHVVHLFVPVHASGSTTDMVISDDDAVSPALVLDSATVDVLRGCGIDVGKWTDLRWWSVRHGEWRDRTVALSSSSSSFSVLTASGIMSSQELSFSSNNDTFKVVTEQRLLDALWTRVRACRNVTVHACDGAHVDAVDVDEFDNRDELNNDTNAGIIEQLRIERARSTIGNERRASTTTYAITAVSHVDGTSRRFHFDWVVASSGTSASSLSSSNCIRPWTSAMSARTSAKSALRGGRYFVRAFVEEPRASSRHASAECRLEFEWSHKHGTMRVLTTRMPRHNTVSTPATPNSTIAQVLVQVPATIARGASPLAVRRYVMEVLRERFHFVERDGNEDGQEQGDDLRYSTTRIDDMVQCKPMPSTTSTTTSASHCRLLTLDATATFHPRGTHATLPPTIGRNLLPIGPSPSQAPHFICTTPALALAHYITTDLTHLSHIINGDMTLRTYRKRVRVARKELDRVAGDGWSSGGAWMRFRWALARIVGRQ